MLNLYVNSAIRTELCTGVGGGMGHGLSKRLLLISVKPPMYELSWNRKSER